MQLTNYMLIVSITLFFGTVMSQEKMCKVWRKKETGTHVSTHEPSQQADDSPTLHSAKPIPDAGEPSSAGDDDIAAAPAVAERPTAPAPPPASDSATPNPAPETSGGTVQLGQPSTDGNVEIHAADASHHQNSPENGRWLNKMELRPIFDKLNFPAT
jgi:uncharacterized membrane protein